MFYKHLAIAAIKKMNSNADKRNSSEIFLHVVPITWRKVSRNLLALLSPAEKNDLQIFPTSVGQERLSLWHNK